MFKVVFFLVICLVLVINKVNAWDEIDVDRISIECQGDDCDIDDGEISIKKRKKVKHKTIYRKDPLAMPIKGKPNLNDPLAMPIKNKENIKDK